MDEVDDILNSLDLSENLPPESDDGTIEYKRKMNFSENLSHRLAQLRYRLSQGNGQCIYVLGVTDLGELCGMDDDEYAETMKVMNKICEECDCIMTLLQEVSFKGKRVQKYLVRENNPIDYTNIRVGVLGRVDAGKSSLVGVLTGGVLDNGKGSARSTVFHFPHEKESGRTSAESQRIMGFSANGEVINSRNSIRNYSWKEIVDRSTKICSFYDLAGHKNYFKTTISGVAGNQLDLGFLVINAASGISLRDMTITHISLLNAYKIPIIAVISKVDLVDDKPDILKRTIEQVKVCVTRDENRTIKIITNKEDVINIHDRFIHDRVVPVFKVSSVSGEGIDLLTLFLNLVQPTTIFDPNKYVRMNVSDTYMTKSGLVIGGHLIQGTIKIGNTLALGPNKSGSFYNIKVRDIQIKRVPVQVAKPGCYVCLCVKGVSRSEVKRGMAILTPNKIKSCKDFVADIILTQEGTVNLRPRYQAVLNTGKLRTAVEVIEIENYKSTHLKKSTEKTGTLGKPVLITSIRGDRATVKFKLINTHAYIEPGDRFILTQGMIRIIGVVRKIL